MGGGITMIHPYGFQIARGQFSSLSFHINKFGYNTAVGTSYEPITDLGTNVLPSAAGVVSIVSSSANDASAGTGARTIEVQGLDTNYEEITEVVTLTGVSTVTTSASFLRIFRMKTLTAGSGLVNAGNITASIGGSDIARITAGEGQTLMGVYTVPANKTAYLLKFQASLSKNQEAQIELRTKSGSSGAAWQVKGKFGTFANTVEYSYPIPLQITQKTDIQFRAKAGATSEMGIVFDLVLEVL